MGRSTDTIVCSDCDEVPKLRETPYRDATEYIVACECGQRAIDVSDCVGDNSLFNPISGKWSNIDSGSEIK